MMFHKDHKFNPLLYGVGGVPHLTLVELFEKNWLHMHHHDH